jgi:hypothetical protein
MWISDVGGFARPAWALHCDVKVTIYAETVDAAPQMIETDEARKPGTLMLSKS